MRDYVFKIMKNCVYQLFFNNLISDHKYESCGVQQKHLLGLS